MALLLVVDDEPDLLDLLTHILKADGHTVLAAADGPAALLIAAGQRPDLVITDFHMPQMTGMQLAEHLRGASATAATPIVVLSAAADPDLDRDGLITRWLSKPFSPRQLRSEISAVLAQTAALATA